MHAWRHTLLHTHLLPRAPSELINAERWNKKRQRPDKKTETVRKHHHRFPQCMVSFSSTRTHTGWRHPCSMGRTAQWQHCGVSNHGNYWQSTGATWLTWMTVVCRFFFHPSRQARDAISAVAFAAFTFPPLSSCFSHSLPFPRSHSLISLLSFFSLIAHFLLLFSPLFLFSYFKLIEHSI